MVCINFFFSIIWFVLKWVNKCVMCCRVALNISGIFRTRENLNLSSFIQSISPVVGVRCGTSIRADPMAHTHPPHSLINGNGSTFQKWFFFFSFINSEEKLQKGYNFYSTEWLLKHRHTFTPSRTSSEVWDTQTRPDFGYLFIKKKNYAKSRWHYSFSLNYI